MNQKKIREIFLRFQKINKKPTTELKYHSHFELLIAVILSARATDIFRVANRIGLAKSKTPLGVEKQLLNVIPHEFIHDAHHWLILHGRYVCTARKPHCPTCLINDLCEYRNKTVSD